jgi:hypothetical protein
MHDQLEDLPSLGWTVPTERRQDKNFNASYRTLPAPHVMQLGLPMTTVFPLRIKTADGHVINNPSAEDLDDLLYDLLGSMNFRHNFVIVERTDLVQHYIQVIVDRDIDPDKGRVFFVEYRDGGPDQHFRAAARDDAWWPDKAFSAAFELVVKVVQDWAFQRHGWREAMSWERIDLGY